MVEGSAYLVPSKGNQAYSRRSRRSQSRLDWNTTEYTQDAFPEGVKYDQEMCGPPTPGSDPTAVGTSAVARGVAIFIGYVLWITATFCVLMVMESLSAVLHALRLH